MKKIFTYILLLVAVVCIGGIQNTFASDGSIDTSFNAQSGTDGIIFYQNIQADGKIVIGGSFTSYNGTPVNRIARLNPDGSLDTSFAIGTGFNNTVRSIQFQQDGKIVIGGWFTSYNGIPASRIARLNPDGSLDTSFVIGSGFNNNVLYIHIGSDNKIYAGGNLTSYQGVSTNRIARLNSDGSLDTTFTIGTGFNNNVLSIQEDSLGGILVFGRFTTYQGITANRIIRLQNNGSRDTAFATGTNFNEQVRFSDLQPDGKILAGGDFTSYDGTSLIESLVLILTDHWTQALL